MAQQSALMSNACENRGRCTTPARGVPVRSEKISAKAEATLRDMAFVLHLTQRVRNTILAEKEASEPALCEAAC